MINRVIGLSVLIVAAIPVLLASCSNDDIIFGEGTVVYMNLEGGFYGIICDDGRNLDPRNLPVEFEVDGLRVAFIAGVSENQMSYHQWGTIIEILRIHKI